QPEVWIGGARELSVEVGRGGDVEAAIASLGLDGLVDRALQSLFKDYEAGLADRDHILWCELDVVWLGAWLGQACDGDVGTADLLRGELQWVERRDDCQRVCAGLALAVRLVHAARAQGEGDDDQGGGKKEPSGCHATDYQSQ